MKMTPLYISVLMGRTEVVTTLLSAGSEFITLNSPVISRYFGHRVGGVGELALALALGNMPIVLLLMEAGMPLSAVAMANAFVAAGSTGALRTLCWAVEERAVDPNVQDQSGFTALHNATRFGQVAAVQYLLSVGANVNMTEAQNGMTSLMLLLASPPHKGAAEILQILLAAGTDTTLLDSQGCNARTFAAIPQPSTPQPPLFSTEASGPQPFPRLSSPPSLSIGLGQGSWTGILGRGLGSTPSPLMLDSSGMGSQKRAESHPHHTSPDLSPGSLELKAAEQAGLVKLFDAVCAQQAVVSAVISIATVQVAVLGDVII